jgi:hypothetical protein
VAARVGEEGKEIEQNAECRMQNAECRMQNAECRMQNAECRMQEGTTDDETTD